MNRILPTLARLLALSIAFAPVAACGSDDDTGPAESEAPRTAQEAITPEAFQAELAGDSALAGLATAVGGALQAAGIVKGPDGEELLWGEYAGDIDAGRADVRAIFRYRASASAAPVRGRADHDATGASLKDAAGNAIGRVTIGAPVLTKRLLEHNLKKAQTVLVPKALESKNPVEPGVVQADLAAIGQGKRHLHVLSAYGPAVGVDHAALRKAAEATGLFDDVTVHAFARRQEALTLLPRLTTLDVVVWVGAGVIDTFNDGKPDKSIGMTLSRGVFGDELISRDTVKGLLDQPALGGPGLIVLLGGDSLTSDHPTQTGLLAQELQNVPWRVVVGFDGGLELADGEAAVGALLAALAAGKPLADAVAAGTAKAAGAAMTTALDSTLATDWYLPPAKAKFWDAAPSSAALKMYLKVTPMCVEPVGGTCDVAAFKAGKSVPAEQLTATSAIYDCAPTFDGPWFSCSNKNEVTGADFSVRGFLRGRTAGDGVFLVATGAPDKKVNGITVVGEGVIETVDVGGGATTIRFGGQAAASTYVDGDGRCCVAVNPLLVGQKATEQVSTLTVNP